MFHLFRKYRTHRSAFVGRRQDIETRGRGKGRSGIEGGTAQIRGELAALTREMCDPRAAIAHISGQRAALMREMCDARTATAHIRGQHADLTREMCDAWAATAHISGEHAGLPREMCDPRAAIAHISGEDADLTREMCDARAARKPERNRGETACLTPAVNHREPNGGAKPGGDSPSDPRGRPPGAERWSETGGRQVV